MNRSPWRRSRCAIADAASAAEIRRRSGTGDEVLSVADDAFHTGKELLLGCSNDADLEPFEPTLCTIVNMTKAAGESFRR